MSPDSQGRALGVLPGSNGAWIEHEVPLRPGMSAYLTLPRDLQLHEIRRLTAMMLTLVDVNETQYPEVSGRAAPGVHPERNP